VSEHINVMVAIIRLWWFKIQTAATDNILQLNQLITFIAYD